MAEYPRQSPMTDYEYQQRHYQPQQQQQPNAATSGQQFVCRPIDPLQNFGDNFLIGYDNAKPARKEHSTSMPSTSDEMFHFQPEDLTGGWQVQRSIGLFSVVAIIFFTISGGPLGSETITSDSGPLLALLAFLLFPLFVTVPYGAVISELSSAMPEDGGFTIWALNAFGPFAAIQVGWWSYISGILATAVYPQYVLDWLADIGGFEIPKTLLTFCSKLAISLILSVPTLMGTRVMSRSSIAGLLVVQITLIVFVIWALLETTRDHTSDFLVIKHQIDTYNNVTDVVTQSGSVDINVFKIVSDIFWNYDGLDLASVFAGLVSNPAFVYSRAIWIIIALTVLTYVLPLVATILSNALNWTLFTDSSYVTAAEAIGGRSLYWVMQIGSIVSTIFMFTCSLFCETMEITGMADNQLLPGFLTYRERRFGSPHWSAATTLVATAVMIVINPDKLVSVANTFSCLVYCTIFVTAVQLRNKMPFVPRPSRVPGGTWFLVLISVIPVCVCVYLIVRTVANSLEEGLLVLGFLIPPLIYGKLQNSAGSLHGPGMYE